MSLGGSAALVGINATSMDGAKSGCCCGNGVWLAHWVSNARCNAPATGSQGSHWFQGACGWVAPVGCLTMLHVTGVTAHTVTWTDSSGKSRCIEVAP